MKNVLMTGAAGGVATMLRPLLADHFDHVRLSDRQEVGGLLSHESYMPAELEDMAACERIAEGMEGIIHLGGFSVEGEWDIIHPSNIVGCHNMFEAARRQNANRFIFASSNHAIGFYRRSERIGTDQRVRPDGYYGVSKAFGEALGSLYADKFGMRVMSIRIGNVAEKPIDERRLAIWIHPQDLTQLITIGLTHPDMHCEIVYGASDNLRGWWDNHAAYGMGYNPVHSSEDHVEHAMAEQAKAGPSKVGDLFQGGTFCADGFAGDLTRI